MFEIVYRYLNERSGGASTEELLGLLLDGPGEDPAFGAAFLRGLLAEDPRFLEAREDGQWGVVDGHVIDSSIAEAIFVVVDVETTGQRIAETGITEIGAVKVVNGEVVARFDQLVNPGRPIPAYVAQLTGISDAMVANAPAISEVLPAFAEFAEGAVLVAHNAAFDAALLDHHARQLLGRPLGLPSVCTLKLARRRLTGIERASLDALSEHFGLTTTDGSRHRALADAELTSQVFRRVLEVVDMPALRTVRELISAQEDPASERQLQIRLSRGSLERLPEKPGVYRLIGDGGCPLLVARAENVRQAVARLFYGACHLSDRQLRMLAQTIDVVSAPCASDLEARVLEAEWVRKYRPEYNRSDRHLPRGFFVKLAERGIHPRLTVTARMNRDSEIYIGPLKGRAFADDAVRALARYFDLPTKLDTDADAERIAAWRTAAQQMQRILMEQGFAERDRNTAEGDDRTSDFGVLGRLGKLRKGNRSWLANRPDCVIAAPSAEGVLIVFLVVDGLCRKVARLRTHADLRAFVAEAKQPLKGRARRVSAALADVSTIVAHRLREKEGDGLVFPLEKVSPEPFESVLADLDALLPGDS